MKAVNLANVKEATAGGRQLPAGGYVAVITEALDVPEKGYLHIDFDIAEGEYKGYFKDLEDRAGFWGLSEYRSYEKETALPMLKRFCSAVTKSNPGFIFDAGKQNADETTLKGKLIGLVIGEEEYNKNNGDVGTRLKVSYECEVEKIRKGDFRIPAKKCLDNASATNTGDFMNIPQNANDEIPFN